MREKQVPVDVVEMKETIIAFAWEPNGSKFAVLHGEAPRISVFFYHVKNNGKTKLIKMFDQQQTNGVFLSPQGQFVVLAGLRSTSQSTTWPLNSSGILQAALLRVYEANAGGSDRKPQTRKKR
ncbi:eukaryotic translation initiation factor 3 subunit B-like [Sapajus apella]|uniref:Eukaryotic translation initiation factor 3 subunit B-like n=1 Tax=Sapajus apella TaxID=9515 RepID=A0A6J3I9K2_SAPAP|nr:eukaryotic translation initiation factor 3 subunit B-like [Sapajus apella]